MSHLQKAFIAKSKAKMRKGPQRMQRGLLMREATHEQRVGPMGSKKNPKKRSMYMGLFYNDYYTCMPEYLQFTLKK